VISGKHVFALCQHLFTRRIEIRRHFNRNSGISRQRRNLLHNFMVFLPLFCQVQLLATSNSVLNFGVFSNQSWVRCLAIDKSNQGFYPPSFVRIATIHHVHCFGRSFI